MKYGKDVATVLTVIFGGLNISLTRTVNRIRGFFLAIPAAGILNGIAVPLFILCPRVLSLSEKGIFIYVNIEKLQKLQIFTLSFFLQ